MACLIGTVTLRQVTGTNEAPSSKGGIMKSRLWVNAVLVALAIVVACARKEPAPAAASGETSTPPAASVEKTYPLRGKVVSVDPAQNRITVDHEKIEGLWEPMSMAFEVRGGEPGSLPPEGSTIQATLHVEDGRYWLTDVRVE
jgi:Cu/Ag efflux protein CusF